MFDLPTIIEDLLMVAMSVAMLVFIGAADSLYLRHLPNNKTMIKGVHTMFYSSEAAELRAFLRDKLGLKATDIGEGWLIFDVPEADMGVHPADPENGAPSGTPDISFYCDDIEQTVAELKAKGVEFRSAIEDHGYGFVTHLHAPGNFWIMLYQPKYGK